LGIIFICHEVIKKTKILNVIIYPKTLKSVYFSINHKMAQQQGMQMPGAFGGLMRYNEEYKSKFMIKPSQVVLFIILIVAFVAIMKIFFPIPVA
jgi:preprotein translocase subunit Sec61beta